LSDSGRSDTDDGGLLRITRLDSLDEDIGGGLRFHLEDGLSVECILIRLDADDVDWSADVFAIDGLQPAEVLQFLINCCLHLGVLSGRDLGFRYFLLIADEIGFAGSRIVVYSDGF
jgi:hypothetical protein